MSNKFNAGEPGKLALPDCKRYTHGRLHRIYGGTMKIDRQDRTATGVRFSVSSDGREIARAYLYVMTNDLHKAPFGLLEDVHVDESQRGGGMGSALVREALATARELGCYKLIATSRISRPKVHALYERLGFEKHGVEFRINLAE